MRTYDEDQLLAELRSRGRTRLVAFATACAEWSFPLLEGLSNLVGDDTYLIEVRKTISTLWRVADEVESTPTSRLPELRFDVGEIPDSHYLEGSLAENASAAANYAFRAAITGDPQQAAWAARQMYEAADLVASERLSELIIDQADEKVLISSAAVQDSLNAIYSYAQDVKVGTSPWDKLSIASRRDGERWMRTHVRRD